MTNKGNVQKFTDQLTAEFRKLSEEEITPVAKKLGFAAHDKFIARQPVDTGHSKAGWQVTLDTPFEGQIPDDLTDKSGETTMAAGRRVIESAPDFPHIFITNNVEYIEALDDGHSQQAPDGLLEPVFSYILDKLDRAEDAE